MSEMCALLPEGRTRESCVELCIPERMRQWEECRAEFQLFERLAGLTCAEYEQYVAGAAGGRDPAASYPCRDESRRFVEEC